MKKRLYLYLLLTIITLFSFNINVEADLFSEAKNNTCEQLVQKGTLNVEGGSVWFEGNLYDVNCVYTITSKESCNILQIAINKDGTYNAVTNHPNVVSEQEVNVTLYRPLELFEKDILSGWIVKYNKVTSEDITNMGGRCPVAVEYTGDVLNSYVINGRKNMDRIYETDINVEIPSLITTPSTNPDNEEDCKTILGKTGVNALKAVKNLIFVAVPIILIVLGVLDFAKAIFSGDENDMKKVQGKFIKRVILAVVIFLIPTVLGVVLDIAHNIWPNIDNSLCGIR